MVQNKALVLKAVPQGWPKAGEDLVIEDVGFDPEQEPEDGGITIKTYYVSFDPYQRGKMRDPNTKSYSPAFAIGKPITNRSIARVLKSSSEKFSPGDIVLTQDSAPTAEYGALSAEASSRVRKLENPYNIDPKVFLGALGMPGLTAYSSFYAIGEPKRGETIFISSAAGAVGQLVGQLAKHEGLKVIGSVGNDKKLEFITQELGFDGGFNYKKERPSDALKRLAPDGIDIYYENVGGEQLEAAINALNVYGRIIASGMISQYNLSGNELYPIRNLMTVVKQRLKVQGFIVSDPNMGPKYFEEHQRNVQRWIADGTFKAKTDTTVGLDNAVDGFLGMLSGKNFGKAVLQVVELDQ
ncbi:NAD(P)-binding protein [Patellaria atrata CBS 101060]|uniref:NAD(P)-binding protein n=1 Tax=Patellaria atrata CBS 101060 TaxID=1346257 RepID=A0A9P4SB89_9PEZI|nr:NAD(P)-binding protein [Patellaria atrata CBS 101060]